MTLSGIPGNHIACTTGHRQSPPSLQSNPHSGRGTTLRKDGHTSSLRLVGRPSTSIQNETALAPLHTTDVRNPQLLRVVPAPCDRFSRSGCVCTGDLSDSPRVLDFGHPHGDKISDADGDAGGRSGSLRSCSIECNCGRVVAIKA